MTAVSSPTLALECMLFAFRQEILLLKGALAGYPVPSVTAASAQLPLLVTSVLASTARPGITFPARCQQMASACR